MNWMRLGAAALTVLIVTLAADAAGHASLAQIQTVPRQEGAPPVAAPTAEAQEGAPLAAPVAGVEATPIGPQSELETTFTPIGLFMRADTVVKAVLLLLMAASFWSWVVIVDRWLAFGSLNRNARRFEKTFWSGRPIDDLYSQYSKRSDQPMAMVFVAGLREWKRSAEKGGSGYGLRDRVDRAINVSIQRETEKIERGLNYLATVGSTAPFVGLFGTVWGIMHSFQAIALRNDTTLAVVAPGIAEALFATALGLLAAIPAVVAYNRFSNDVARFAGRLEAFADEFSTFLSRKMDERDH